MVSRLLHRWPITSDQRCRKWNDVQERVNDQAKDQPPAELAVMEERDRRKPGGPGRVSWRRACRARVVEKLDRV